jgi:hypothetical protein
LTTTIWLAGRNFHLGFSSIYLTSHKYHVPVIGAFNASAQPLPPLMNRALVTGATAGVVARIARPSGKSTTAALKSLGSRSRTKLWNFQIGDNEEKVPVESA